MAAKRPSTKSDDNKCIPGVTLEQKTGETAGDANNKNNSDDALGDGGNDYLGVSLVESFRHVKVHHLPFFALGVVVKLPLLPLLLHVSVPGCVR